MINFHGTGQICSYKQKGIKTPYFMVVLQDNTETSLCLQVPYSFKKIIIENERVTFKGIMNEDGIVEVENLTRAHLEPLGFNFISENEDVFSFTNKGLVLKVDLKTPKHNLTLKTFQFLAKAGNLQVLDRLTGILENKKVSIKGIFKNNVGILTTLETVGF